MNLDRACEYFETPMLRCSAAVAHAIPCIPKAVVRSARRTYSAPAKTTQGFPLHYMCDGPW